MTTGKTYLLTDGSTISFNDRAVIGSPERSYVLVHYKDSGNVVDIAQPVASTNEFQEVVLLYCARNGYELATGQT